LSSLAVDDYNVLTGLSDRVPDTLNDAVATFLPSAVVIGIALLNWSPWHFVHGMLALVSTR
jgi:hypothetical protein